MPAFLRHAFAAVCAIALAACQHAPPRNPMATWVPSQNFDVRRAQVIVLHYTEQGSVEQSLHTLRTRNSGGTPRLIEASSMDGSICWRRDEVVLIE